MHIVTILYYHQGPLFNTPLFLSIRFCIVVKNAASSWLSRFERLHRACVVCNVTQVQAPVYLISTIYLVCTLYCISSLSYSSYCISSTHQQNDTSRLRVKNVHLKNILLDNFICVEFFVKVHVIFGFKLSNYTHITHHFRWQFQKGHFRFRLLKGIVLSVSNR